MVSENNTQIILNRLHEKILTILVEIDRICSEENISYFLDGGTALGAIRHGGFIPWDDDADVGMLRDQYEKFKSCCLNGKLTKGFTFQDYSTDKNYSDGFIRIRLDGTLCVIDYHKERGYKHLGIFVDIFPFDYSYTNDLKLLNQRNIKIKKTNRLILNKLTKFRELSTIKSKFTHTLLLFISRRRLFSRRKKLENIYNKNNPEYCVSTYTSYKVEKKLFPVTLLRKTVKVPFSSIRLNIVENYDLFLKNIFGNYMLLPPPEKQVAHIPSKIDFGS